MSQKRQEQFDALLGRISTHLKPEQVEQLKGVFAEAPEAAYQLGEEVMARNESARIVTEYQQREQSLAAERAQLTDLATKVNEYDRYLQTAYVPREQFDQLTQERAQLAAQFEQLSTTYPSLVEELGLPSSSTSVTTTTNNGVNMPNNLPNGGQVATPQTQQPVQNPIRNVTELQWNTDKQQLAALSILSPAAQHDLAVRHQKLYGTPLENMTEIVQESANTGQPLEQVWAAKYNVTERLQQLENERIESTVSQRVDAELAKRMSAGIIGGTTGVNANQMQSPFLQRMPAPVEGQAAQPSVTGAPDLTRIANQGSGQGTAATRAAEAYLSGKYKNERFDILTT